MVVGKYDVQPLLLLYHILIKWPSLFILFFLRLGRAQGYKNLLFPWPWLVLIFDTHHHPGRERAFMREPIKHRTCTFVIKKEVRRCHHLQFFVSRHVPSTHKCKGSDFSQNKYINQKKKEKNYFTFLMCERMHVMEFILKQCLYFLTGIFLQLTHENTNNRQNLLSVNYVLGTMKST